MAASRIVPLHSILKAFRAPITPGLALCGFIRK